MGGLPPTNHIWVKWLPWHPWAGLCRHADCAVCVCVCVCVCVHVCVCMVLVTDVWSLSHMQVAQLIWVACSSWTHCCSSMASRWNSGNVWTSPMPYGSLDNPLSLSLSLCLSLSLSCPLSLFILPPLSFSVSLSLALSHSLS